MIAYVDAGGIFVTHWLMRERTVGSVVARMPVPLVALGRDGAAFVGVDGVDVKVDGYLRGAGVAEPVEQFVAPGEVGIAGWEVGDGGEPAGGHVHEWGNPAAEMPEVSEDGTTYTYTLRDGVNFGPPLSRPVTSADVAYAFKRIGTESIVAQ